MLALVTGASRGIGKALAIEENGFDVAVAARTRRDGDGGLKVPVPPILFDEEASDPPPEPDSAAQTDELRGELGDGTTEINEMRTAGKIL
jgi:NAD(P)-dependent dehydrogenase (short-subunit alcohol dehydrogenase family)